jgi:hypothetical protein
VVAFLDLGVAVVEVVGDPDAWIAAGFVYRGIGRGDKNRHALQE